MSSVFEADDSINILTKRFLKNNYKESEQEKLYKKMGKLKSLISEANKIEVETVVERIEACAEHKYNIVMKELEDMKQAEEKINSQKFWKLKKKIVGKHADPPAAMLDDDSNLLTSDKTIQERAIEVYKDRLT